MHRSSPTSAAPRLARTQVLGVLGGIAAGKSAVARLLAGKEGVVLDADELVAGLYLDPQFRASLARTFGPDILDEAGALDRAALARRVFADQDARKRLERLVHPRVRETLRARLAAARAAGAPRVVLDVPLLLENESEHHLASECDALVFVDAPQDERDARAVRARGWAPGEVARREALQLPLAEKRSRAAHVIVNDRGRDELERKTQDVLRALDPGTP